MRMAPHTTNARLIASSGQPRRATHKIRDLKDGNIGGTTDSSTVPERMAKWDSINVLL